MKRWKKSLIISMFIITFISLYVVSTTQKQLQASTTHSEVKQEEKQLIDASESEEKLTIDSSEPETNQQQTTETSTSEQLEEMKKAEAVVVSPPVPRSIENELINKLKEGWVELPLNSTEGVIINQYNSSKIGFRKRGINIALENMEQSYGVVDFEGENYLTSGNASFIPMVNQEYVYPARGGSESGEFSSRGIGYYTIKGNQTYYLKKGDELRQIIIDTAKNLVFVFDLSLKPNLNFAVQFSMYNTSNETKTFSIIEYGNIGYGGTNYAYPSVSLLGNKEGFYGHRNNRRATIKLKDSRGHWISDFTKFMVSGFMNVTDKNYFGLDSSKTGYEDPNVNPSNPVTTNIRPAYQLGTALKSIAPQEALVVGHELYVGKGIPYMQVTTRPSEFNIYSNHTEDLSGDVEVSKIPELDARGIAKITFPNGSTNSMEFRGDYTNTHTMGLIVPRRTLPDRLNENRGTIKTYYTDISATTTSGNFIGLPSEDYSLPINVYNFGAQSVAQMIQKGTPFTKKASELVTQPIILPGNTAEYSFEGDLPDTSVEGLTFANVRMTDTKQPDQTTVIRVPILVYSGSAPTSGIAFYANNVTTYSSILEGLNQTELNQKIMDLSDGVAWDIETGLSAGVDITVDETTLVPNPESGLYTAKLKATKGTLSSTKDITINVLNEQNVTINFVDETEKALHEPVILRGIVGSTINLTEEETVQKVLKEIEKKHYRLTKAPENESAITVEEEEKTVQYAFKGTLFIESFPATLDFGDKYLNRPLIKAETPDYDSPLIIGDNRNQKTPWVLTATLQAPLTSKESPSEILPRALLYKINESTKITLQSDVDQPIEYGKVSDEGTYNISENWDKKRTGIELNVFSNEVIQKGQYSTTILWQIGVTP